MINALVMSNVLLWLALGILIFINIALVRQVGILYGRIAPAGALMIGGKHSVGDSISPLGVVDLEGNSITIGGSNSAVVSTLVFFLSSSCPVCKELLPILKSMQKEERAWLRIIFASDGEVKEHKRLIVSEGLAEFPYVLSLQLGMKFEVSKLPFAVLMDDKGILKSKGLVNTREHLESLVQAAERDVGSLQEYMAKEIYKNDRSNLSYKVENL